MSMACCGHLVSGDIRGRASSDQLYWLLGLSCKGRTEGLAGCVEAMENTDILMGDAI